MPLRGAVRPCGSAVQVQEAFGEHDFDATGGQVDEDADLFRQWDEHFARGGVHSEERRAAAGKLYIADFTQAFGRLTGGVALPDRASGQIADEMASVGKGGALGEGNLHVQSHERFGLIDRVAALEVENSLAAVAVGEPAGADAGAAVLASGAGEPNLAQLCEPMRKIREDVCGDFALAATWADDASERDACPGGYGGYSRISRV